MRLINTGTLELLAFTDSEIPGYAILSHTWGPKEITQHDMLALTPSIRATAGFEKVSRFCELALKDGYEFGWVDTCCIDKTSSAELSEAINSMYNWYNQASACYAFLADVPTFVTFDGKNSPFKKSRWFTRGWTLQELLAPRTLIFLSAGWHKIGTKSSLSDEISQATGIGKDVLIGDIDIQTVSIACRMSWAAHRKTTRVEDIAYCLMGLFDVNMPMLYGEGQKAFIRLQEEIVKNTEDHTIFAWEDSSASDEELRGLLAPHPRCFGTTGDFHPVLASDPDANLVTVTNRGISFRVLQHTTEKDGLTAMLNCTESNSTTSFAYIHLLPLDESGSKSARIRSRSLGKSPRRGTPKAVVVSQKPRIPSPPKTLKGHQWFTIDRLTLPKRFLRGGDRLAFFTVSEQSATRPLKANESLSVQKHEQSIRITGSPSDFLFQVPQQPNQLALSLYITAEDTTGFGFSHHARIDVGVCTDVTFAIAALSLREGDTEYEDQGKQAFQPFVQVAKPLPARASFELENPMTVVADLSWKERGGETIACIVLDVVDDE